MTDPVKGPGGAPAFAWTAEIENEIFRRVANGEAIRNILATGRDEWLPSWDTFRRRVAAEPEFSSQYARAREDQADGIFDEVQEIADNATPETVAVDKLRIDTRKWRAGKLRPKVYGDKLDLSSTDGTMSMPSVIQFVPVSAKPRDG